MKMKKTLLKIKGRSPFYVVAKSLRIVLTVVIWKVKIKSNDLINKNRQRVKSAIWLLATYWIVREGSDKLKKDLLNIKKPQNVRFE